MIHFLSHVIALATFITAARAATKPNVLVLVTDDQRVDSIAALGNDVIKTPNCLRQLGHSLALAL